MEKFDVFASEGGYRYAGSVYLGGPVINQSPWFKTKGAAEKAAKYAKNASKMAAEQTMLDLGITEDDLKRAIES